MIFVLSRKIFYCCSMFDVCDSYVSSCFMQVVKSIVVGLVFGLSGGTRFVEAGRMMLCLLFSTSSLFYLLSSVFSM